MAMNIFRFIGDMSHLGAIFLLLWKIWKTKSVAGISFKSQAFLALVFVTRYLDIFHFISVYNTCMKLTFIGASLTTCYLIYFKFKGSHDRTHDIFGVKYVLVPCVVIAFFTAFFTHFNILEMLWIFSIDLEAVAILPQLWMVQKTGEAESITSHYLFAMGSYRAFYLLNWIYRYVQDGHRDWVAIAGGMVQTVLYSDFLYLYITKVLQGQKLKLPS